LSVLTTAYPNQLSDDVDMPSSATFQHTEVAPSAVEELVLADVAASEEGGEVGGRNRSENAARDPTSLVDEPEERVTPEGRPYVVEYVSVLPLDDSKGDDGFGELIRALSSISAQPCQPNKSY
jgi:hypothetical protein